MPPDFPGGSDGKESACNEEDVGPLSVGFSRQDYWSGLPFPSPGDLRNPGIKTMSPALQAASFPLSHQKNPNSIMEIGKKKQNKTGSYGQNDWATGEGLAEWVIFESRPEWWWEWWCKNQRALCLCWPSAQKWFIFLSHGLHRLQVGW